MRESKNVSNGRQVFGVLMLGFSFDFQDYAILTDFE
jgi:hypothetical protein